MYTYLYSIKISTWKSAKQNIAILCYFPKEINVEINRKKSETLSIKSKYCALNSTQLRLPQDQATQIPTDWGRDLRSPTHLRNYWQLTATRRGSVTFLWGFQPKKLPMHQEMRDPIHVSLQAAPNELSVYHVFLKEKETMRLGMARWGIGEELEGSAWGWSGSKYIVCV